MERITIARWSDGNVLDRIIRTQSSDRMRMFYMWSNRLTDKTGLVVDIVGGRVRGVATNDLVRGRSVENHRCGLAWFFSITLPSSIFTVDDVSVILGPYDESGSDLANHAADSMIEDPEVYLLLSDLPPFWLPDPEFKQWAESR